MNSHSCELTGPFSTQVLEQINMDLAFIGVNGFDSSGPGTTDEFEAFTNRAMASRAVKPVVVADSSKFGKRSFSSVGGPEAIRTVVTDSDIDSKVIFSLQERGYDVVVAS